MQVHIKMKDGHTTLSLAIPGKDEQVVKLMHELGGATSTLHSNFSNTATPPAWF